jgi:hypothetical protein
MRYIEEGLDKDGNQCWFVLDDAELISIYNTQQEAEDNL